MLVRRPIRQDDYELLSRFYGRDLGGPAYFNWKNFLDPSSSQYSEHQALCFEENQECLGLIYSRHYRFRLDNAAFRINLIGDLGVDRRCQSRRVAVDLYCQAIDTQSDLIVVFADETKTFSYEKILHRHFTKRTQVIRYTEVSCRPDSTEPYLEVEASDIPDDAWRNHFGRKRDRHASDYTQRHPLYGNIHYLRHEDKYLTLGVSDDCAEVLDISDTSGSHFRWGLGVAAQFGKRCRVLVHERRTAELLRGTSILHKKPVYMLIGYLNDCPDFDDDRVWVGRIDRR